MKKLRVAIVGQGRSGYGIHGHYFKSELNDKYEVVAVVDRLESRREKAKKDWDCDVYASHEELYARDDIDLVVNSTFSFMHKDVTKDLLSHGFNVVCEKPFVKSYEDGQELINLAKKNGVMVNVFQQSRFAPYYRKIKEIIASGVLGEPIQYSISFSGFNRRWDWQTSLAYMGGNVRNTGPHPLDQAMDILGFPEECNVFSSLGRVNTYGDAEDYAKIVLTVPGKPLVDVEISSCNPYSDFTYKIHCKNGGLKATQSDIEYKYYDLKSAPEQHQILDPLTGEDGEPAYCSDKLEWTEEKIHVEGSAFMEGTSTYYTMIYDYLVNGKPMEITPEQVLTQLKVIDKIHAQNPLTMKE